MRFYTLFLAFVLALSAALSHPAAAAAASGEPSVTELEQKLAELTAQVEGLRSQVETLKKQIKELKQKPPAPEEEEAANLRAAAEQAAAAEETPTAQAEQPAFTAGSLSLQALNPEISVTGDFISSYQSSDDGQSQHFENHYRSLDMHLQSYLDPYSRFKAAVEVHPEETELGEAYFTRFGWRPNCNLTLGKFRQQFGVVNRWHKHSLDQLDFPLPLRQIFGEDGLNQTGVSLDWQMPPAGNASQELTFQLTNGENERLFGGNTSNMPAALVHYKNYRDLNKDTYLEFGLTGLAGRNDTWDVSDGHGGILQAKRDLWTTVLGLDLTMLWEPTERMRYQNWVWRTEAYLLKKDILAPDGSGEDTLRAWGAYSYFQKKLNRTTEAGLRVDYFEPDTKAYADTPGLSLSPLAVTASDAHQWLIAPYVTWWQSPWVRWRLEWDHQANHNMGADSDAIALQCTFAAGPHKHERY